MSRMNAIRAAATSGLIGAGIGGVGGGVGAAYAGQDIKSGMIGGAVAGGLLGAGMNARHSMGLGKMKGAAGVAGAEAEIAEQIAKGKSFLGGFSARGAAGQARRTANSQTAAYNRSVSRNKYAGITSGALGGSALGVGYATLASNNGSPTIRDASLEQRFQHESRMREMKMNYNVLESERKKEVWQGTRY